MKCIEELFALFEIMYKLYDYFKNMLYCFNSNKFIILCLIEYLIICLRNIFNRQKFYWIKIKLLIFLFFFSYAKSKIQI